ncbi:MAG: hypothetical protein ACRC46_00910 [Thermoguttaceae bacterium]
MVSSLRTIQTLILAVIFVAVGCKTLPSQQQATQQPNNPFDSSVIPPPATGSYAISNPNYSPPPGMSAFTPVNTGTTTPPTSPAPTPVVPTGPAAIYGGSYGSLPLTSGTTAATSPSTLPANVLGQSLDQGSPLPITSRAGTAEQGVASRLHDSSNAVSSSTQTTTVGK